MLMTVTLALKLTKKYGSKAEKDIESCCDPLRLKLRHLSTDERLDLKLRRAIKSNFLISYQGFCLAKEPRKGSDNSEAVRSNDFAVNIMVS